MEINKKCEVCGRLLPESEFSKSYRNRCKECVAKQTKEKRDQAKARKNQSIVDEYFDDMQRGNSPSSRSSSPRSGYRTIRLRSMRW